MDIKVEYLLTSKIVNSKKYPTIVSLALRYNNNPVDTGTYLFPGVGQGAVYKGGVVSSTGGDVSRPCTMLNNGAR